MVADANGLVAVVMVSEMVGDANLVAPVLSRNALQSPLAGVVDLRSEVTPSISLSQGKRTKVVAASEAPKTIKKNATKASVRKSGQNLGPAANIPAMEKAQKLAAMKNLDVPVATCTSDDFSILDAHSDAYLSSVISDSCIVFIPSVGSPLEAVSLIRAKEQVQSALAAVATRKEHEEVERAAREAAQSEDMMAGDAVGPSSTGLGDTRPLVSPSTHQQQRIRPGQSGDEVFA
ncbi:hypothetical protein ACQ4PT_036664 [Festuca glaucescens]